MKHENTYASLDSEEEIYSSLQVFNLLTDFTVLVGRQTVMFYFKIVIT